MPGHPIIRACIFDAYGTLFDVAAAARALAEEIGPGWTSLSDIWRQKQLSYSWLRSLMREYVDFWQVTTEALDYALTAHHLTDPGLRRRLLDLYAQLTAYPEVPPLLKRLRAAGQITGIFSNGSPAMLASACSAAGVTDLLDHIISVDDIRVFKPDPRTYQLVTARLGLPAPAIAFFSANGWDAQGGRHAGFHTLWINRLGLPRETMPFAPDIEANNLAQAVERLGLC